MDVHWDETSAENPHWLDREPEDQRRLDVRFTKHPGVTPPSPAEKYQSEDTFRLGIECSCFGRMARDNQASGPHLAGDTGCQFIAAQPSGPVVGHRSSPDASRLQFRQHPSGQLISIPAGLEGKRFPKQPSD